MGTNFYWKLPDGATTLPTGAPLPEAIHLDDPAIHIGKRSAAGRYCWDCGVTLCVGGNEAIHSGESGFYDRCPRCGKAPGSNETGSALVELGFAQPEKTRPSGVQGCCSFSWAQDPEIVGPILREHSDELLIESEYGDVLSCGYFLRMLECNCPIQFTYSVGHWFS